MKGRGLEHRPGAQTQLCLGAELKAGWRVGRSAVANCRGSQVACQGALEDPDSSS